MTLWQLLRRLFRRPDRGTPSSPPSVMACNWAQPAPQKKRRSRKREYRLYSMDRYALRLTNHPERTTRDSHPWIFTVNAVSVRQAYFLAYQYHWAEGPGAVGLRRIELDPWHWEGTAHEAREDGLIQEAPYMRPQATK